MSDNVTKTPLAAAGLAVIMVGAAVSVAVTMNPAFAVINLAIAELVIRRRSTRRTVRSAS